MARNFTVRNDSNFCRDCGGKMIKNEGQSWCVNVQVNRCIALKRELRNYCENDGTPLNGSQICSSCNGHGSLP